MGPSKETIVVILINRYNVSVKLSVNINIDAHRLVILSVLVRNVLVFLFVCFAVGGNYCRDI